MTRAEALAERYETLLIERPAAHVVVVRLNRPDVAKRTKAR